MRKEVLGVDIQLKRGMLEICVLAVLCRGDSYGYQLVKDISPYITAVSYTHLEDSGCSSRTPISWRLPSSQTDTS